MASKHRVVWSEGMFLRPQHFQQFERYLENYVETRIRPQRSFYWGFHTLELDEDALALGKILLHRAHGVMPDGTPFAFSGGDDAPPPLDVPAGTSDVGVVLALPVARQGGVAVSFDGDEAPLARYAVLEQEVADANAVALEPAVMQLGRLRLRLMLASELTDEWQALGVVRVLERRSDNRLALARDYIPPMLAAGNHPLLAGFARELHGLLDQRSAALAGRVIQPDRAGAGELADLMLLELVNRHMAATWHAQHAHRHPEQLFLEWLELACGLATHTSPDRRCHVMPIYRHDDLWGTFAPLMEELRRSLSMVLEQNAFQIPLHDRGHGVSVAQIPDIDLVRHAGFVLAVHADMPASLLRARFPTQAKIGPVERIRDLVHLQLPGVTAQALPVAPRQIPYHAGHVYFELDKGSELWKQLEQSGGLALHLAGEFPGLSMEFWAIRQ
ncbi:MAG: type VI secretion system baseplate subunit TssK [Pigmentiphaga sp.]|uniref:type VI secretion system baseplate subunit TssK n=1 Tax=Pigmentiphaga sp. TaxID=1977564 RepID=UPI0029B033C3|nr:type VI secretion system baseplate subunit TssK [Pigmentiphaga sp.]MDX3905817.1 type VI secretion system baseplate subunit TssK [Pigmentiphaga sp.]